MGVYQSSISRPLMVRIRLIDDASSQKPCVEESIKIRYGKDDSCYRWTVYARPSEAIESVLRRVGAQMIAEDREAVICTSCNPRSNRSQFRFHSTLSAIKCNSTVYTESDLIEYQRFMANAIGNVVAKSNECIELTETYKWIMGPAALVFARKYRPFPDNESWFWRGVSQDLLVEPKMSEQPLVMSLPSYESSERINSLGSTPPSFDDDYISVAQDKETTQPIKIARIISAPVSEHKLDLRQKLVALDNEIEQVISKAVDDNYIIDLPTKAVDNKRANKLPHTAGKMSTYTLLSDTSLLTKTSIRSSSSMTTSLSSSGSRRSPVTVIYI